MTYAEVTTLKATLYKLQDQLHRTGFWENEDKRDREDNPHYQPASHVVLGLPASDWEELFSTLEEIL